MSKDTIYRQDAIDAVSKACFELRGVFGRCEDALNALPPAQPEVIRCKDCKYYDAAEHSEENDWCHAWSESTTEDGFCHRAERREDG